MTTVWADPADLLKLYIYAVFGRRDDSGRQLRPDGVTGAPRQVFLAFGCAAGGRLCHGTRINGRLRRPYGAPGWNATSNR